MTYTINRRSISTTVYTEVEYDFDGIKVIVNIPHFNPQSEDDIILGIENRAVTEQQKLIDNNGS